MGIAAELDLEQRIARVEAAVATLAAKIEKLDSSHETSPGPDRAAASGRQLAPAPPQKHREPATGSPAAARPLRAAEWFTTKSAEWWLGRFGVVFTSLALVLLYQYAVEQNWITPLVRVVVGVVVGIGLFYAGTRVGDTAADPGDDEVGLRELLLAGGLAAWYITAYAAAVFYQLIPVSTARLIFLTLSIASAWLALREKRSLFGVVAVATGFAAPFLLWTDTDALGAFSLYVAALAAVGLVLYLMRGWQSVVWVTFAGSWWTIAFAADDPRSAGSLPLTMLVVAVGLAFVRAPVMRRQLVATGSDRYILAAPSGFSELLRRIANVVAQVGGGSVSRHDSPALWVMTIAGPLFTLLALSAIWPTTSEAIWGAIAWIAGLAAFRFSQSPDIRDPEVPHMVATAATIWTLAGLLWLSAALGELDGVDEASVALAITALHAASTLSLAPIASLDGPRAIALFAAGLTLTIVFGIESEVDARTSSSLQETAAELVVLAVSAMIWKRFRASASHRWLGVVFGVAAYLALLMISARVLGGVWPPLVTAAYAIAGAVLLVASKRVADGAVLRKLGGGTMLLVVGRLFAVDLAGVETIWRVLLFLVCGLLFLCTSYWLQRPAGTARES
ncbi:MAG: DUF2339 domain-containing protein [Gemmatimonadaceae bacterium]|nr:DUF2339 domain-containing protein [Gemmatimonadaceae bacterium]